MSALKTLWGLFFRLFPCPTETGLRAVGRPGRESPVLVTCNFHLTVKRLVRVLERAGVDAWLLVADSKGVNVWCAAGAEELDTRSVVSVLKTSGVADEVDGRRLIAPPLAAPGVDAAALRKATGWKVRWGPVRMEDIPAFLAHGQRRDEAMRRADYGWRERLDTAMGSLFPFYLLGAVGFAIFGRSLLVDYLVVGALVFVVFFLSCPWLPGRSGLVKSLSFEIPLGLLALLDALLIPGAPLLADLLIAMIVLPIFALELGGLASTMPSDLDPFLARLGVRAIGNVALAGTIRTDLLNGYRELRYDDEACKGCGQCVEVCPVGVWERGGDGKAVLARREDCVACRACLVQCEHGAVDAPRVEERD